ncbi:MAG: hypothetical protein IT319_11445 [Anaerolineae bacterium]|nr:hypothetical protein [Anaerolineae bacterium]
MPDETAHGQWMVNMLDRNYWRATYDQERGAFVVEQAGWVEGEPQIEYRFTYLSFEENEEIACQGGLDKWWLNGDGSAAGEFFAFGKYPDQVAFDAAVEHILQKAEQRAQDDNLDFFLVVIDIVKEQAVEAALEDESLFDFEGLFELGSEDAYSQHPYGSDRLHDHVARTKEECWRLQVARVVDPQQKLLDWSLCVVLYPTLSSQASMDEINAAEEAHTLELSHFDSYSEAVIAINGTLQFMLEDGRVEEPDYAFMDDSEVFELMSVHASVEGIIAPEWDTLKGASLLHVADQLYARLLESMKIVEPLEDDSPWREFD